MVAIAGLALTMSTSPAGASAVHPAQSAADTRIIDGNGADLPILIGSHNTIATMAAQNSGSNFTKVADGGDFELEGSNGQCLTVNAAQNNEIYSESCSEASSTLWFSQAGGLYTSVLLNNEGITGHLTSNTLLGCLAQGTNLFAQGGVAAGNCHIVWNGP